MEQGNEQVVVKIQMPIVGEEVLVYNKDRSLQELVPITDKIRDAMDGELKKYFLAELHDGPPWLTLQEIEAQDW